MVVVSGPASASKAGCCGCFQRQKRESIALSEMYCRACSSPEACAQRAPLGPLDDQCMCNTHKIHSLLNQSEYELGKEQTKTKNQKKIRDLRDNANFTEFEFADDAISLNGDSCEDRPPSRTSLNSSKSFKETTCTENPYINVNGKEELPCAQEIRKYPISNDISVLPNKQNEFNSDIDKVTNAKDNVKIVSNDNINIYIDKEPLNFDSNYNKLVYNKLHRCCTLPKQKFRNKTLYRPIVIPPHRITPDGTHIFYWCDLPRKTGKFKS